MIVGSDSVSNRLVLHVKYGYTSVTLRVNRMHHPEAVEGKKELLGSEL